MHGTLSAHTKVLRVQGIAAMSQAATPYSPYVVIPTPRCRRPMTPYALPWHTFTSPDAGFSHSPQPTRALTLGWFSLPLGVERIV